MGLPGPPHWVLSGSTRGAGVPSMKSGVGAEAPGAGASQIITCPWLCRGSRKGRPSRVWSDLQTLLRSLGRLMLVDQPPSEGDRPGSLLRAVTAFGGGTAIIRID